MKVCTNCNNYVADDAVFCNRCGASFAVSEGTVTNNQMNYAQQPYGQQIYNQGQQPQYGGYGMNQAPYQPPKKKGLQWWHIVLIVVAFLVIVAVVIGISGSSSSSDDDDSSRDKSSYSSDDYDDSEDDYTSEDDLPSVEDSDDDYYSSSAEVEYTKGAIVGDEYQNEWAGFKYEIAGSWTEGTSSEYAGLTSAGVMECGLVLNDEANSKQIQLAFMLDDGGLTEDECLESLVEGMEETYTASDLEYEVDPYYDTTVAGETYRTAEVRIAGGVLVQKVFAREYEGKVIFFTAFALDEASVDEIVDGFKKY